MSKNESPKLVQNQGSDSHPIFPLALITVLALAVIALILRAFGIL